MTDAQIYAGTLTASRDDRTATGLLVPYGEQCSSNLGRFAVDSGAFSIPEDLAGIGLNVEHEREEVVGQVTALTPTDSGIVATFSFARTPEGDQALEDVLSGKRRKLSAEVKRVAIRAGRAVAGRVFGAALVKEGAFPSATLLAAAVDIEPEATTTHNESEFVDENGVKWRRVEDVEVKTESTETGEKTTTVTTVTEETEEPETPADETKEDAVSVPNTLTAAKVGGDQKITQTEQDYDLPSIFASIAAMRKGAASHEQSTLLAALADIKTSGTNALPAAGVLQKNWVGLLWQGKEYSRKYINLAKLGTDISIDGKKGFTIHRGTASTPKDRLGGDWTGNKTEVPTGQAHTKTLESTLDRFAFAADIAREFYDLPGGAPVVEAFMRLIVEDYATWSDEKALLALLATAGSPVAPRPVPNVGGHTYSPAMGQLIQGIRAVSRKDTPSFAIVNATAYEELLYTPKDQIPEYVSLSISTEGNATADGKVQVVEAPDSYFTTVEADTPATLVGARNAVEFDEVSSTPIQIDALEIAKGGVDKAVHGYLQTFKANPAGVVLIGTADTP